MCWVFTYWVCTSWVYSDKCVSLKYAQILDGSSHIHHVFYGMANNCWFLFLFSSCFSSSTQSIIKFPSLPASLVLQREITQNKEKQKISNNKPISWVLTLCWTMLWTLHIMPFGLYNSPVRWVLFPFCFTNEVTEDAERWKITSEAIQLLSGRTGMLNLALNPILLITVYFLVYKHNIVENGWRDTMMLHLYVTVRRKLIVVWYGVWLLPFHTS